MKYQSSEDHSLSSLDPTIPLLRIRLFGGFELEVDGRTVSNTPACRGLMRMMLILLALNQGHGLPRETIVEWLWPDKDPVRGLFSFYNLWSRTGAALSKLGDLDLDNCPYLICRETLVRLNPHYVVSDVGEFESLARQIIFGAECFDLASIGSMLDHLESLYRGDILGGRFYHPRIQASIERFRNIMVDVLIRVSQVYAEAGKPELALWYANNAYDLDREREDVYRILMSSQGAAGQRIGALRTFYACQRFLDEELGLEPSKEISTMYQQLIT
jgi:DNA-binding SARP family transcriptional activator